jgi:hypothetical protein
MKHCYLVCKKVPCPTPPEMVEEQEKPANLEEHYEGKLLNEENVKHEVS